MKHLWLRTVVRAERRLIRRYPFLRLITLIVALWVFGALVLRLCEGRTNEEFDTMPKALWNISVYLFSGLDQGIPQTPEGKTAAAVVLILSLGLVAVLTGSVASFLVERRLGSKRRMPAHDLKDHIVICNWNDKGIPIMLELHAAIVHDPRPVVVVSGSADAAELPDADDMPQFEDVYLIKGSPAREVFLRRANVHQAYSVIILADPADGDLADAKSILIAMAVRSVCDEASRPKTHVCVECLSAQNIDHLRRAGADEIVSASDFAMMLLSQTALVHGLSRVYRNLLTVSGETNEVYVVPIPGEFVGKSFADLGEAMFESRDRDNPAILIGVMAPDGPMLNPLTAKLPALREGDQAIVVAWERPESLV